MATTMSMTELDWNMTTSALPVVDPRDGWPQWKHSVARVYPYLPTTVLVCIMLAMGCSLTVHDLLKQLRRPVGIIIGAGCQFILFPLVAFGLAHALRLSPAQALGLLITACSPGGTSSNVYTYYSDGDLPLSICMTVIASVLALGMMPLNLFIYARSWTSDSVKVPYVKIATTLASVLIPVLVGMLVRWKLPKLAKIITKVGAVLGMALLITVAVLQSLLYPHIFTSWWQVWVVSGLLPYAGFGIGYLLAFICRRDAVQCRTIAIETGIQNMGIPYTVLALSYAADPLFRAEATVIPILTGKFIVLGGLTFVMAYQAHKCAKKKSKDEEQCDDLKKKAVEDSGDKPDADSMRNEDLKLQTEGKPAADTGIPNAAFQE